LDKKARDEALGGLADKDAKIELRRAAIAALFDNVTAWLKTLVEEGIVQLERGEHAHSNEQLGALNDEILKVIVGASTVLFSPRAHHCGRLGPRRYDERRPDSAHRASPRTWMALPRARAGDEH
jgi:hypothetical protein